MSDLFDAMKTRPRLPKAPMPVEEVRRRGDRMRRRRTTFRVAGSAALVLAVAVGVAGTLRPGADSPPQFVSRPSAPPIPASFPLAQGWPRSAHIEGPSASLTLAPWKLCGHSVGALPRGARQVVAKLNEPEDIRTRVLRTYPDEQNAAADASAIRAGFETCLVEPPVPGQSSDPQARRVEDLHVGEPGAEAFQVQEIWGTAAAPAIGTQTTIVVRQGRSVLMSFTYGEGSGFASAAAGVARDLGQLGDALAAQCRLVSSRC